jgi:hypothetical protein
MSVMCDGKKDNRRRKQKQQEKNMTYGCVGGSH